jgi:ribosome-binding protein aMBF1 (putative translation factor)
MGKDGWPLPHREYAVPNRMNAALHILGWSQRDLAKQLQRDSRQVRRWGAGEYPVPPLVLAWLETLAAFHRSNPPPGR